MVGPPALPLRACRRADSSTSRARLDHDDGVHDDGVAGTGADEIKGTLVGLAVAEKPSSLSDEDQQTSPCRMVVAVVLQVSGQVAYTSASGRGGVT